MSANRWIERTRRLRVELFALYLAARHPQTPWYAKLVVGFVAYAVTPVDLFPLAMRFVPSPVLAQCRARAQGRASLNSSKFGLMLLLAVWAALAAAGIALYI
jgi:hypothetical protein